MNIIELIKQIVSEFPQISKLSYGVSVDFTSDIPGNCGLYPTGDQLIKEDIIGNQERKHTFLLYAVFDSLNDYQRLSNSSFLLDLAYWLEHAAKDQPIEVTIDDKLVTGTLTKISSANGMLYGYQNDTLTGPVTYQLQIYAQYHLESEVLL